MNFSRFFIDRPIFAGVIAIFITLIGAFALPQLPLSQYPQIAPPTIQVSTAYPGASAETLASTVAAPLEQQINGVEGMLYMSSSSTSNGVVSLTVTFKQGVNLDAAQVLVQNRVALAEPHLPAQVRQIGVTVNKASTDFLMVAALTSDQPGVDINYIGNYANSSLRDKLLRLDGVGEVSVFGGGNYSMRVWIDPGKAAALNLTSDDIVNALRNQNVQVAGGSIGQPPYDGSAAASQLPIQVEGQLSTPEEFSDIVLKTSPNGDVTRLRDVARVEIGAQDYSMKGYFSGKPGIALAFIMQPGANALATADRITTELKKDAPNFPAGIKYTIPYNPTEYVAASVNEVEKTLLIACALVVVVVIVFLQTWRAAIIPILAIPIALIGSMTVLLALGFSLNSLSLFGLVLAVGIVVDDAIVVVESVERHIGEGLEPRQAAYRTMQEVSGALVAIGLVLVAVFVPTAFVSGIPGQFYRQFAVTISAAAVISLLVSQTLSPALAAILLKPHKPGHDHGGGGIFAPIKFVGRKFNEGFSWLSDRYGWLTGKLVRTAVLMLIIYACLLGLTAWRLVATPKGFIPEQDQGFLIGIVNLPVGASLDRTDAVTQRVLGVISKDPMIVDSAAFAGLDGSSFSTASNSATVFIKLADFKQRHGATATDLAGKLTGELASIQDAQIIMVAPPAVQGLGNGNGFKMDIQDVGGQGYQALQGATYAMMGAAAQDHKVEQVYSTYSTATPRITATVDRVKAQMLGVQPADVYSAMGTYLGSTYVNDFNLLGRTFQVNAQAEGSERASISDIGAIKVRNSAGEMVPISSVADIHYDSGPARVVRYNLFPAAELQGEAAPGVSSGAALAEMEQLAAKNLPPGFAYEWTELAYQQKAAGSGGAMIFILAVVFVFLVLAALYEALTLPLAVILIVPMCIFAAMLGVNIRGQDNNILTQIGLIVLVALAAKNAILIVEFAKQGEEFQGMTRFEAAVYAARTRLRPILMTSFAFVFGVLPLAIAAGPGHEMRQALGTAVFFGMIGVTLFGLIFTPVFYVVCRWIGIRLPKGPKTPTEMPTTFESPVTEGEA